MITVRSLILIVTGAVILTPTLSNRSRLKRPLLFLQGKGTRIGTASIRRQITEIISGKNYIFPRPSTLVVIWSGAAAVAWTAGFSPLPASIIGTFVVGTVMTRTHSISMTRQKELQTYWPILLDQTRSTMLASRRALQYVIFDQGYLGSKFLAELILVGKKEFERSGDFTSALLNIKNKAGDPCTTEVCTALIAAIGASTAQIESQLTNIVTSITTRNELANEANSRLAGVRMARLFIILIPAGMALVGVSFAGSVKTFETPMALLQELTALFILSICWFASNLLMKFPKLPSLSHQLDESQNEELP